MNPHYPRSRQVRVKASGRDHRAVAVNDAAAAGAVVHGLRDVGAAGGAGDLGVHYSRDSSPSGAAGQD